MKRRLERRFTFISNQLLRIIPVALIGIFILPLSASLAHSQSAGKEGNRAVGVVFNTDGAPFGDNQARVAIFNRDTIGDSTNRDGVYSVAIPKSVSVFQLTYTAPNYWGGISDEISSTKDPIKIDKFTLRKKDAKDKAQLEVIDTLLRTELAIYKSTSNAASKKAMRDELIKFGESIEIPAWDPTMGMTMQEREMRIRARTSIDAVVARMK
jgi:hypothetical protein